MNTTATPLKPGTAKSTPTPPSRMTLANVKRGRVQASWRVLVYGVEGVGKTTLAAATPTPIFLGAEDGSGHLDVPRFPAPTSWADVKSAVEVLLVEKHDFRTLVLDTVDWAEPLLWDFICARDSKKSIEDYGYGKGYQAAIDEWRVFLTQLEKLRGVGVNVMLLGHSQLKLFKNPEGDDFDRYELKLNAKAGGLIKEWCDAVLFANHETFAKRDEKTKRVKGISTGARWLYTTRTAAYDAKNRFGFPDMLPLSWPDVEAAMAGPVADVGPLLEECRRKGAELGQLERIEAAIGRAAGDTEKLAQLNTWLNAQLALKAEQSTTSNTNA